MGEFLRFSVEEPPRPVGAGADRWSVGTARWASQVRTLVRTELRAKAPVSKSSGKGGKGSAKTGAFRNSITYRTSTLKTSVTIQFGSPLPYTPFIVDGTRPHVIRPRSARMLHWQDADGDRFARMVNHPGTRPNDFATRAVEPLLPAIQASFAEAMTAAFTETLGGAA